MKSSVENPTRSLGVELDETNLGLVTLPYTKVASTKYRVAVSLAYIFSFIGLAFGVVVVGISLPSIAIRYGHTHATDMSAALVGHSIGGTLGTLLMGNALQKFGHRAHGLMVFLGSCCGLSTIAMPFFSFGVTGSGSVLLFSLILLVQAIFQSMFDIGGNVLLVEAWGPERKKDMLPYMNLLHFSWGAGATLLPLVAVNIGLGPVDLPYLFLFAGLGGGAMSLPLFFFENPTLRASATSETGEQEGGNTKVSMFNRGQIAMTIFFFSYSGVEQTFGDWLTTYTTMTGNSLEEGALAVTIFFGSITGGRLFAALISNIHWLSPERQIAIDILGGLVSTIAMFVGSARSITVLYVASAGVGFSLASIYPMGIIFGAARVPHSSSKTTSRFVAGAPLGGMVWPPVVGMLLSHNIMAMPVAGVTLALLLLLCFLIMLTLAPAKESTPADASKDGVE